MCIGIPMQVAELDGAFAWCEGRGRRERLNTMLLEVLSPGDWVYATLGHAREKMSAYRAYEINLVLDGLAAALQGETILDSYFPNSEALQEMLTKSSVRGEPDVTSSHSTRLSQNDNQVAGYVEP